MKSNSSPEREREAELTLSNSFNKWSKLFSTILNPNNKLLCESNPISSSSSSSSSLPPSWESGKIMQQEEGEGSIVKAEKTEAEIKSEKLECKRCEGWRDDLINTSPIVRFMLQHVALLPDPSSPSPSPSSSSSSTPYTPNPSDLPLPITCLPCPPTLAGGYSPSLGILLCQNRFMSKEHMQDALTHELVHAWDGRRFEVEGEWGEDLRAHACTEIRAENLSGDCRWMREINRRNFSFTKQHQTCVRRRAILSVTANPNCKSKEEAEKAVNEVWESCFSDTRPFDEVY